MRIIRLLILMVMMSGAVVAQNSNNPWQISLGVTAPSISKIGGVSQENLSPSLGGPQAALYRKIVAGLSIGGQISLGTSKNDSGSNLDFFSMHAGVKYGFNVDNKFSPYLKAGVYGSTSLDGTDSGSLSTDYSNFGSVGLDYSLGENLGAFLEYSIGKINDNPEVDYGLISLGVSYGFGSGDSDKDGVRDKKDKCPDVPGLKEFEGCPDTDEDGIPDPEDDCPEAAGPEENKGCPDTDGDGVLDKDDSCPEEAGSAELNGCPDNDGDGVANPEDECPDEAGPAENKGCPWPDTDNDGVADKDDECPDTAGNTETGCPELTNEVMFTINQVGSNILFPASSSKIIGSKTIEALKEVKSILDANTEGKLIIEGHASSDGSEAYNLKLSQDRAESVLKKLIELGADPARLETKAFGESKPLIGKENDRAQNRRVEFHKRQ